MEELSNNGAVNAYSVDGELAVSMYVTSTTVLPPSRCALAPRKARLQPDTALRIERDVPIASAYVPPLLSTPLGQYPCRQTPGRSGERTD